MNLKESFRYQKFLDGLMMNAGSYLQHPYHCLETTKVHLRHAVNPEAEDMTYAEARALVAAAIKRYSSDKRFKGVSVFGDIDPMD